MRERERFKRLVCIDMKMLPINLKAYWVQEKKPFCRDAVSFAFGRGGAAVSVDTALSAESGATVRARDPAMTNASPLRGDLFLALCGATFSTIGTVMEATWPLSACARACARDGDVCQCAAANTQRMRSPESVCCGGGRGG